MHECRRSRHDEFPRLVPQPRQRKLPHPRFEVKDRMKHRRRRAHRRRGGRSNDQQRGVDMRPEPRHSSQSASQMTLGGFKPCSTNHSAAASPTLSGMAVSP